MMVLKRASSPLPERGGEAIACSQKMLGGLEPAGSPFGAKLPFHAAPLTTGGRMARIQTFLPYQGI